QLFLPSLPVSLSFFLSVPFLSSLVGGHAEFTWPHIKGLLKSMRHCVCVCVLFVCMCLLCVCVCFECVCAYVVCVYMLCVCVGDVSRQSVEGVKLKGVFSIRLS